MKVTLLNLIGIVLILCGCVDNYNPYEDPNMAQHHIRYQSFEEGDSLKIFSAETLIVTFTVKDLIDSFSIQTGDSNRFVTDTVLAKQDINYSNMQFCVSYINEGPQQITLKTYRRGIDPKIQTVNFYTYSPLTADSVQGYFGETLILRTEPVEDPDVFYRWDFGYDRKYSPTNTLSCVLTTAQNGFNGKLVVYDTLYNTSPARLFNINLLDTLSPTIRCYQTTGDTIRTADSIFTFKVFIAEQSGLSVDSASINGHAFDTTIRNIYRYTINKMYTYTDTPFVAKVTAFKDISLVNESDSLTKTFYILFDKNVNPSNDATILFESIEQDSILTTISFFTIFGKVESKVLPARLKVFINNTDMNQDTVVSQSPAPWIWKDLRLVSNELNTITVKVFDSLGSTLIAKDSVQVYHNNSGVDKDKPVIWEVLINDTLYPLSEKIYIPNNRAILKVTAFDNTSGMEKVLINNKKLTEVNDLLWKGEEYVPHDSEGKVILIEAVDKANNKKHASFSLIQNTFPSLAKGLNFPQDIFADSTYVDTLEILDEMNGADSVILHIEKSLPNFTVQPLNAKFLVTWSPTIADTGTAILKFWLKDVGFESKANEYFYEYPYTIKEKSNIPRVRFKTRIEDFPEHIETGAGNPLNLTLAVQDTTGVRPFSFTALVTTLDTFLIHGTSDNVLKWEPFQKDTGTHQLFVTVIDRVWNSDTLFHSLTVIPKNEHPCSLTVSCTSAVIINDTLDLSSTQDTLIPLVFTIIDKDHPLSEIFHVLIESKTGTSDYHTKERTIAWFIKPTPLAPVESLRISIKDKTGTNAIKQLTILHPAIERKRHHALKQTSNQGSGD